MKASFDPDRIAHALAGDDEDAAYWRMLKGQQQPEGFAPSEAEVATGNEFAPPTNKASMRSYTPSWAERIKGGVSDAMHWLGADRYVANNLGDKVTGAAQFFPPTGVLLAKNEMDRSAERGEAGGTALAALGALPAAGPGLKAAAKGAMRLSKEAKLADALGGKRPLVNVGAHPSTDPALIANAIRDKDGLTVHVATGQSPTDGIMMGKYANTDPRNSVVPKATLGAPDVSAFAKKNLKALNQPENYLGGWNKADQSYLDVSRRYEPSELRKATKAGERTGQLAGWDIGKGAEIPVGNFEKYVNSPEFISERLTPMFNEGRAYMQLHPESNWWKTHGTSLERVYGKDNVRQVAGFTSATSPAAPPVENVQVMSEYMRRHLKGEPTIQPDWRTGNDVLPRALMNEMIPGAAVHSPGKQLPMEANRIDNLGHASRGDLEALQADKVNNMGRAMVGDPRAVVLDRHYAKISEDAAKGVYPNVEANVIKGKEYQVLQDVLTRQADTLAKEAGTIGITPNEYSAYVWTGIREHIKNHGELFGTPYRASAIVGDSKGMADHFDDLIRVKARQLDVPVAEVEKRLGRGDINLMSWLLVASPAAALAYGQMQSPSQPNGGL